MTTGAFVERATVREIRKPRMRLGVVFALLLLALLPARSALAATPAIVVQPAPSGSAITVGPDGNLWYVASSINSIVRMTLGGAITSFPIPTSSSFPSGIATGPDGHIWFTELGAHKIGTLDPATGTITEFVVPGSPNPGDIVAGPDGNMWFGEDTSSGGKVGRITPSGVITLFSLPPQSNGISGNPGGITAGPPGDQNLWVAVPGDDTIESVNSLTGAVTVYPVPTPNSKPEYITAGPDGDLWFTEQAGNQIGRLDPTTGVITEFALPTLPLDPGTTLSGPEYIAVGPDGNLWFGFPFESAVGEISTTGALSVYSFATTPTPPPFYLGIVSADGAAWMTVGSAVWSLQPPVTLASGAVGASYDQTIPVSGGTAPYTFTTAGTIPNGLTLNAATGELSGTPTTAGSFTFTVRVTDAHGITAGQIDTVTTAAPPHPDHFRVTVSTTTETTGTSFPVTVTALDATNHMVMGYSGPVTLTDTSGSLSTSSISWSGGVGSATVSVGTAISRDRVTATDTSFAVPPTGTSTNVFAVTSPVLNHFHLSALPASFATGDQVQFSITALDAGSQVITSFAGPVTLTDATGTLSVVSVVWTNGVGVATVSVGAASARDRITAVSGSVSDVTGVFNVLGPVASFRVSVTLVSGEAYGPVTVTAVDSAGQVVTGFAGPVTLTDAVGGMSIQLPGTWVGGVEKVGAYFLTPTARDRVTANDGNGHSGVSAVFVVPVSYSAPQSEPASDF